MTKQVKIPRGILEVEDCRASEAPDEQVNAARALTVELHRCRRDLQAARLNREPSRDELLHTVREERQESAVGV